MTASEKENAKNISATEYILTNFQRSDRLAVLVRNSGRGETVQRITTAGKIAEPSFHDWLHHKNEKESFDIYIGMNTLKPEARTRTKEDIETIRHLYMDIDHDGPAALAKIQQSNLVPPRNYTINTSPDKFQVVWRVENISQEQAESLQRAMVRKFGGDPAATDSTRVLRLPGFLNRKYQPEFLVQAAKHTDRVYHPQDFRLRTELIETDFRPHRQSPQLAPTQPRQLSQSEHDWAYAKRALARGDDPEELIRRIADFRAGEKHDPQDYARRTVTKAQADLHRGNAAMGRNDSQSVEDQQLNQAQRDVP
ncbi:MAG: DNA-primase RepB domain-containing protein [Candidatus Acidiferrum sp.]